MNATDYIRYRPEQLFFSGTTIYKGKYNVRTTRDNRGSNSVQLPKSQERTETTVGRNETRRT